MFSLCLLLNLQWLDDELDDVDDDVEEVIADDFQEGTEDVEDNIRDDPEGLFDILYQLGTSSLSMLARILAW